tara:strand:+ start:30 stop:1067 length:1038 start_codon:yes stop_codon:yes gene_type:complete
MEQKEKDVTLNANKRKSLCNDLSRHLESQDSYLKEDYLQARERCDIVIPESHGVMTKVVQRRFKPEHIFGDRSLTFYKKEYNTLDVVGTDSCFFMKSIDAPKVLDSYDDEVEKSKHFSWHLDGKYGGDYTSSHYNNGSSNSGKNFSYAYYREDMKKVGLNPDCNIENDINNVDAKDRGYKNNPYLSQCRNDNHAWLNGTSGGTNYYQKWEDKYALHIIGTGGCRSRAIPCTDSEFAQFEMMHIAKENLVRCHTAWIGKMLEQVQLFKRTIQPVRKFSVVKEFAKKYNWEIAPEILADKFGMDIVISVDNLVDQMNSIVKPKDTQKEKIKARVAYEQWQQSSRLAS